MKKPQDNCSNGPAMGHLPNDLLVAAINDELSLGETARVESHLSQCAECKQRYREFRDILGQVEALVSDTGSPSSVTQRQLLAKKLDSRQLQPALPSSSKVLRRFSWGMGIAATLALGIVFAPQHGFHSDPTVAETVAERPVIDSFQVNGETFAALPYSNPDLPVSTSHIVQMEIPVSSLTDAGVAFEPVSTQEAALDHSVLADVLVGMDGQPLGVHVLSTQ